MTPDEPPALGSLSVVLIPEPDPVVTGRQCASGEPLSCEPWLSPWHFLAALPSQGWCGLEVRPGRAACCAAGPGRSPCLPFLVRLLCRERQRLHCPVLAAAGLLWMPTAAARRAPRGRGPVCALRGCAVPCSADMVCALHPRALAFKALDQEAPFYRAQPMPSALEECVSPKFDAKRQSHRER